MTMTCPVCSTQQFSSIKMEGGLPAEQCAQCQGVWVELERYRDWRRQMPDLLEASMPGEPAEASGAVRLCPLTGRLMIRIRVSNDDGLLLDYSAAGQGVWFDQGEWDRLIGLGLHDVLDAIVSDKWQADLRAAASRERVEKALRARFGDADYDELERMRAWLDGQPNRTEMIAFLTAKAD
jgi:Zn-finger nucleic acid-binding protein